MPPTTQIRIRRDTAANFTSANPTLALGEIAYETDTFRFKVGTGSTAWTSLGYAAQNPTSLTVTDSTASTSTTTGALVVTGGVGIGGALNTGADAFINGARVGIGPAGTDNTVLGVGAGAALQATADNNVLIGRNAGALLSTQDNNIAIGRNALDATSTGSSQCVAIGSSALGATTSSGNSVAIGNSAASGLTGGSANVIIGADTVHTGSHSNVTAVGYGANGLGGAGTSHVCAFGNSALLYNRANDVVAVGSEALDINTLGTANVAVGRSALGAATTSIGTFTTTPVAAGSGYTANQTGVTVTLVKKSGADTFTGTVQAALTTDGSGAVTAVAATPVSAGSTFTGSNVIFQPSGFGAGSGCEISIATLATAASNTALGHQAGLSLTTASNCTFVGDRCGDAVTTGSHNIGIGRGAFGAATTGNNNLAIGVDAGSAVVTGLGNIAIGNNALLYQTSGNYNVAIGAGAIGIGPGAGGNITTGHGNICIGTGSQPSAATGFNQVMIAGYDPNDGTVGVTGDGNNTTVIGNVKSTQARLRGATFLSTGANGQSTQLGQSTTLLSGLTGATVTATNLIPANSILLGVTARVTTAITGATTFDIGTAGTPNLFGDDVAIALNTTVNTVQAPTVYAAATDVILAANTANFTGGAVRLTAHFITLVAPTS